MRKKFFLWSAIIIAVLTLVLAFENIWLVQQYYVLFFTFNASTTVVILLGSVLGFLVGFFAMLYSYEVKNEKEVAEESDELGSSPAAIMAENKSTPQKEVEHKEISSTSEDQNNDLSKSDEFDDDDEVLG